MSEVPALRFISLFVPDLHAARSTYEAVLGVPPVTHHGTAPAHHPFAASGPVVFQLGDVSIALYQCDLKATHPGDVGLGLEVSEPLSAVVARARAHRGRLLCSPSKLPSEDRELTVLMLPDRHFFEVVGVGT